MTSSVLANWVPDVQVLDLPFIFRNEEHAIKANALLKSKLGNKFEAQGFHLLGFSVNGARELISTFPIEKPEDVKGKKMRVIQSPIHIDMWKAVGANPVPIPAPEIYTSLQNKVVDYFDNTTTNYYTFRFYEVAKNFTKLDPHLCNGGMDRGCEMALQWRHGSWMRMVGAAAQGRSGRHREECGRDTAADPGAIGQE